MARTIGVKYKNKIKKIVLREKAKGENAVEIFDIIKREVPNAFETWEMAYQEIERITWDLATSYN